MSDSNSVPSVSSALDAMRQLQRDIAAIRRRGATPIQLRVTPEFIQHVEVAYPLTDRSDSASAAVTPMIYGIPFDLVAELPNGLMYTIEANR